MGDVVVTREDREAAERLIDNTNDFPAWLADDLRDAIATMRAQPRAERDAAVELIGKVREWARSNLLTCSICNDHGQGFESACKCVLAILDGKE